MTSPEAGPPDPQPPRRAEPDQPGARPARAGQLALYSLCAVCPGGHRCTVQARLRLMTAGPRRGTGPGSPTYGTGRTTGRSPPPCTRPRRRPGSPGHDPAARHAPSGPQRAAFPFGQPAPDAVDDPVGDGVVQARLPDRARRADLPRGPGGLAAAGEEHLQVGAAARSQLPPARSKTRRSSQAAVPRRAGRHRAGAVTRARQAAAKAARSATSRPLAANSSANRRG